MCAERQKTLRSLPKTWTLVFIITSLLAGLLLAGTAIFMVNVKDTRFVRGDQFSIGVTHNCLTAYATAAYLASIGMAHLYHPRHYRVGLTSSTPIHKAVNGIFHVDEYLYPPQFLILPYGLWALCQDFFVLRTAWFVLTITVVLIALAGVALWGGAFRSRPQLLLFPLLLCAPVVHTAIQIENIHIVIVAISLLAMIAFDEHHEFLGGALLGFAVVAKIWPAVLLLYLLIQRRWKPVIACNVAIGGYTGISLLLFGFKPYQDFFTFGLQHVESGESLLSTNYTPTIIENMSVFGIFHKLDALNILSFQPARLSSFIGWSFTMILGTVIIATGLRRETNAENDDNNRILRLQLWLSLLTLGQLRSPFLPWHYGVISTLWLLLVLMTSLKGWTLGVAGAAWLCLATNMPVEFLSMTQHANIGYTLFAALLMCGAIVVSLRIYYVSTTWGERILGSPASYWRSQKR
ncbi:hypothetical protein U14_01998 [Candidatus Moduliflexus flocculans]|uniref:DUF2029 domain-containing protein n=1 Tax=Candidatus Moduliflexus flocculans TaxID=1499966 RepID=A0A0S6VTB7_9BACT|nr:hypothetical protein U14_01998 [Candidatus Moduliflexus flocculans]